MNWKKKLTEKAQTLGISSLVSVGVVVVIVGLIYAFGLQITGDVRDDMTTDSAEYNATVNTITGMSVIPNKLGTIMLIVAAAIIIGILIVNLGGLGEGV